jgi:hypothetical protein
LGPPTPLGPPKPAAPGPPSPEAAERARRLLAKGPAPAQPKARPPGEAEARPAAPVVKESGTPPLAPGEIACPNCGRGNGPERHFCRRCGFELIAPPPPPPVPAAPPPVSDYDTSEIPRARDTRPWYRRPIPLTAAILGGLVAVVVLGLLARTLMNAISGGGDDGGNSNGNGTPVAEAQVAPAAAEAQGGQAGRAIDGDEGTAWPGEVPSEKRPARIRVTFSEAVDLSRVEISPGGAGDDFDRRPRPHRGWLELSDGARFEFELDDEADGQSIAFPARRTDRVDVYVTDAYDARPGAKAPITELRFFGPGKS